MASARLRALVRNPPIEFISVISTDYFYLTGRSFLIASPSCSRDWVSQALEQQFRGYPLSHHAIPLEYLLLMPVPNHAPNTSVAGRRTVIRPPE